MEWVRYTTFHRESLPVPLRSLGLCRFLLRLRLPLRSPHLCRRVTGVHHRFCLTTHCLRFALCCTVATTAPGRFLSFLEYALRHVWDSWASALLFFFFFSTILQVTGPDADTHTHPLPTLTGGWISFAEQGLSSTGALLFTQIFYCSHCGYRFDFSLHTLIHGGGSSCTPVQVGGILLVPVGLIPTWAGYLSSLSTGMRWRLYLCRGDSHCSSLVVRDSATPLHSASLGGSALPDPAALHSATGVSSSPQVGGQEDHYSGRVIRYAGPTPPFHDF